MNWIAWIALALGAAHLLRLMRLPVPRKAGNILALGGIVFGLFSLGVFSGIAAQTSASGTIGLYDATFSSATVAASTDDYVLSNSDHAMDIYIVDSDIADDQYVNVTMTLERTEKIEDAASVEMICTFSTKFTSGSTNYDLVSLDTYSNVEAYIDGSGAQTSNSVKKLVTFSAGDADVDVTLKFKQDESAHDAMTSKQSLSAVCNVGGKALPLRFIENG